MIDPRKSFNTISYKRNYLGVSSRQKKGIEKFGFKNSKDFQTTTE